MDPTTEVPEEYSHLVGTLPVLGGQRDGERAPFDAPPPGYVVRRFMVGDPTDDELAHLFVAHVADGTESDAALQVIAVVQLCAFLAGWAWDPR